MRGTRLSTVVAASLLCLGLFSGSALGKARSPLHTSKAVGLRDTLRDLWIDQVFWVRAAVWSTKAGDVDATKVAEERIARNAKALGAALVPYVGQDAGEKLAGLLSRKQGALREYMAAAYGDGGTAKEAAAKKLTVNAYEIASFLSSASPTCAMVGLVSLLSSHAIYQLTEVDNVALRNHAAEADTWETSKKNAYEIADTMAEGIVKQFPRKF